MPDVIEERQSDGPGRALRTAREAADISVREIANALNIPSHIIEAIEADDEEELPSPVFTRGYVRSYARLLELDPDPLVAALSIPAGAAPRHNTDTVVVARPQWWQQNPAALYAVAGVAGLLLVGLLALVLWPSSEETSAAELTSATEERPALAAAPGAETQVSTAAAADAADDVESPTATTQQTAVADQTPRSDDAQAESTPPATLTQSSPSSTGSLTGTPTLASAQAEPAQAAPVAESQQGSPVRRLDPQGEDELHFMFTDECWVEVKSTDGRSLYIDLGRGGDQIKLVGTAPFRILLGYAPRVTLRYNGELVPLVPHTRNNVAKLVLGQ